MTVDLVNNTTPFGLLDAESQEALRNHDGDLQYFSDGTWHAKVRTVYGNFTLFPNWVYRIKEENPMVIPWDAIHPDFNWAAADEDGSVWLYSDEPEASSGYKSWVLSAGKNCSSAVLAGVERGTVAWDQSLQKRPGV